MMPNHKFRNAVRTDYPVLKRLWRECFSQSIPETDLVFDNLIKAENSFVAVWDGVVAGMLFIAGFTIRSFGRDIGKGAYIYGVGVDTAYRGRGIASNLLEYAHDYLIASGYKCAVLLPAGQSLFDFYGRLGYSTAFYKCGYLIDGAQAASRLAELSCAAKGADRGSEPAGGKGSRLALGAGGGKRELFPDDGILKEFARCRLSFFDECRFFVDWDIDYLSFIQQEAMYYGGGLHKLHYNGDTFFVLCQADKDMLFVREIIANKDTLLESALSLRDNYPNCRKISLRLPDKVCGFLRPVQGFERIPYGMAICFDAKIRSALDSSAGEPPFIAHGLE